MIPKRIFFFWGNERMSWMRYMTIESFSRLNPDWQIYVYTIPQIQNRKFWDTWEDQDFHSYTGEDYIDRLTWLENVQIIRWQMPIECSQLFYIQKVGPSQMSNLFKWYMLGTEGGIYADMDILFIKSFDWFFEQIQNHEIAISFKDWFSIGVLASAGNNRFFSDVYHTSLRTLSTSHYQSAGVKALYELAQRRDTEVFNVLKSRYSGIFNIPFHWFYPYIPNDTTVAFSKESKINPETIGYHWYAGHPVAQQWNNILNEKNYKEIDVLFTKYLSDGEYT